MTQIKEKIGIRKSVVIATIVVIRAVVINGFHCSHLDKAKTYCRILFIDFSPAFDTFQPQLLVKKYTFNVKKHIIA